MESYAFDKNIFFSQMFSKKEQELWMNKKYIFLWIFLEKAKIIK